MNKTRISRFLLAVVLLVVAALSVVACNDTTYKINVTCDSAKGTYELAPEADSYKNGDEVALTVTPKSGYEVDSVKQDDKALTVGTDGKYKITVKDADVNVVITFKDKEVPPPAQTYTIGVACENGKYELSPAKEAYNEGDVVTLTVTPNEGYNLKSVTANGTALTAEADGSYKLTVAKANIDVVVTLEEEVEPPAPATYTITVNCGENGTYALEPAKEAYEEGDEVKLTVTANEGYLVKSVKIGETALEAEADGSYKLTVAQANIVVAVEFEAEPVSTYAITVNCGENGTYALEPANEAYEEGAEVTLTLTPNEGYVADTVTVNGVVLAAVEANTYKLTVTEALTVNITFKEQNTEPPVPTNLWTGEGAGTKDDPYILSGLNGEITVPHAGLKPDGKPSYTKEWMKWANPEPGKYTIKSIAGDGIAKKDSKIKVCKNGTTSPMGTISPYSDVAQYDFIEFKETDGISEIWISYSAYINLNIDITLIFERAEIPPAPDTNADDYVGTWETSGMKLIITKTSETQLSGEFYYGGQLSANYNFVKGSDNVWLDSTEGYTVSYNADKKTITLSDSISNYTLHKVISEPTITADDFVGIWENEWALVQEQVKLTITKISNTSLNVKEEKLTGSGPANYTFALTDGVWTEVKSESATTFNTLKLNEDGTLTYRKNFQEIVMKKIGEIEPTPSTVDLSEFVGTWNVGDETTATITAGTMENTLIMNFLESDITLTLGDDGALTGTGIIDAQSFRLEKKEGKFLLTVTMYTSSQEYELTKAETPDLPALNIDAKFHGTWNGKDAGYKVVITATSVELSQNAKIFTVGDVTTNGTQISFTADGVEAWLIYDEATGELVLHIMVIDEEWPTDTLVK